MLTNEGRLEGKVAIVAGGGSRAVVGQETGSSNETGRIGTGRAISEMLARAGAVVGVMDFNRDRAQETLDAIEAGGGKGFVLQGSVIDEADCVRVVKETMDQYGRLDTLVNNVVSWEAVGTPITEMEADAWDRQLALGLKSMMLMCKHSIPSMIASGGGSIISVGSVAGILACGSPAYGAAKAGMVMLTRDITFHYGRGGIRANVISPGHIHSHNEDAPMTPVREWRRQVGPLNIEGTGWDLGWLAVFLASDESRFITGVHIPVDGGATQICPVMARSEIISPPDAAIEGFIRLPSILR